MLIYLLDKKWNNLSSLENYPYALKSLKTLVFMRFSAYIRKTQIHKNLSLTGAGDRT